MENPKNYYSLFTAHALLGKEIDKCNDYLSNLYLIANKLGPITPSDKQPESDREPMLSGDNLISIYYDLFEKLNFTNHRFEYIITQLDNFVKTNN
jgi:hypothetical protein